MKHGYVTNGRTTTLYGDTANHWIARSAARHCADQKEADNQILATCEGPFRDALICALKDQGFKVTKKVQHALKAKDAEQALVRAHARTKRQVQDLNAKAAVEARGDLSLPCCLCDDRVLKGQRYHRYGRLRGHETCVARERRKLADGSR